MPVTGSGTATRAAIPVAAPPTRGPRWTGRLEWPLTLLTSTLFVAVGLGGLPGRLAVPLDGGDTLPTYVYAYSWAEGRPSGTTHFGFPLGQELFQYPTADVLQNALAGAVTALTGNPFAGINLVFALSFPATTAAALWVFTVAGLGAPYRGLASLALTFVPFHWLRLEHVYLATMYSAVLGVGLALLLGRSALGHRRESPGRRRPAVGIATVVVIIGLSGIYYACFTVMLCMAALVVRATRGDPWRTVAAALLVPTGVVAVLAAALVPATVYTSMNPPLASVADRLPVESVTYGGSLALFLLPAPVSLVPGSGPLTAWVTGALDAATAAPTSGVLLPSNFGSMSSTLAVVVLLVGVVRSRRRRARTDRGELAPEVDRADGSDVLVLGSVLLGASLLFFVPWGLNFLFAYVVSPQLRGWDRLLPVLFTLVFVLCGAAVGPALNRAARRTRGAFVVLGLGLLLADSVLPYRSQFDAEAAVGADYAGAGHAYALAVNDAVPDDCGVLQLPYVPYPEVPPVQQLDTYDHFMPALTNPDKEWSFGAIKGTRAGAWQADLPAELTAVDLEEVRSAGFCLVHVDARGYTDEGAAALRARLEGLLGPPVATGLDGVWSAYDLRDGPDR